MGLILPYDADVPNSSWESAGSLVVQAMVTFAAPGVGLMALRTGGVVSAGFCAESCASSPLQANRASVASATMTGRQARVFIRDDKLTPQVIGPARGLRRISATNFR